MFAQALARRLTRVGVLRGRAPAAGGMGIGAAAVWPIGRPQWAPARLIEARG